MYSSVRCMTNFKTNYKSAGQLRVLDSGDFPEQGSRVFEYESDGNWSRHSLNYIGNTWFGYKAALEVIDNGDLFEIAQVGTNDKAQIKYVTIHDYNTETFVVL